MRSILFRSLALVLALVFSAPVGADPLSAVARLVPGESRLAMQGRDLVLELVLSQPVPYRLRRLAAPPRLVVDFNELDWTGFDPSAFGQAARVVEMRAGPITPGWSRLVLELDGPFALVEAGLRVDPSSGQGRIGLRLGPASAARFAADIAAEPALPGAAGGTAPALSAPVRQPPGTGPLVVVLDPGHGGIDPGAERDGLREADLMLTFARELQEALLRAGGFQVVLTREEDVFVSLESRVRTARQAGADVFLSLHADALADGGASGATVYTLSEEASDAASAALAERHDRDDLLAGVDLSDADDLIANVLMSIARTETEPRTDRLADTLVARISSDVGGMHRRPRQHAAFSVLKAPDIPSLLIELGFMSSPRDLSNLQDAGWRAAMAGAIVAGLADWARNDAADAALRRR